MAGYVEESDMKVLLKHGEKQTEHLHKMKNQLGHIEERTCANSNDGAELKFRKLRENQVTFGVTEWSLLREKEQAVKFFLDYLKSPEIQQFLKDVPKVQKTQQEQFYHSKEIEVRVFFIYIYI